MQLVYDDKIVGYDVLGEGKVLLMLHGWGANRSSLLPMAKELAKNYKVILLDVPGFGESERMAHAWGLSEYAQWLTGVLKKLKLSSIYAVIGHSNGGAIAIKTLSGGLLATNKLVLLGASGVRNRENGKRLFLKSVSKTGKLATRVLPERTRNKLRSKWYKRIGSELYEQRGMEATFKKVVAEDLLVDAAMIDAPTLLIYGTNDKATPLVYGKMYHEVIEGSRLVTVENAGHYSFIDQPKQVTGCIKEFLKK